jgi:hypothetical protein
MPKITIKKFLEVQSVIKLESDILDREMKVLSIVYDKTFDEIQSLPISKLKRLVLKTAPLLLNFGTSFPKTFRINNIKYRVTFDLTKISGGQYVDIKVLDSEKPLENIHTLCAILCLPVKDKGYIGEDVPERAELFFNELDINIAHPMMRFFFRQYLTLSDLMLGTIQNNMQTSTT